jgi:hypothetical protein
MNIPYTAVHFSVYESAKKFLLGRPADADDAPDAGPAGSGLGGIEGDEPEEGLAVQLVAGGLAGGAAAAVTTPLDVVKTRLQTEGVHSQRRYGTTAVVRPNAAPRARRGPGGTARAGGEAAGGRGTVGGGRAVPEPQCQTPALFLLLLLFLAMGPLHPNLHTNRTDRPQPPLPPPTQNAAAHPPPDSAGGGLRGAVARPGAARPVPRALGGDLLGHLRNHEGASQGVIRDPISGPILRSGPVRVGGQPLSRPAAAAAAARRAAGGPRARGAPERRRRGELGRRRHRLSPRCAAEKARRKPCLHGPFGDGARLPPRVACTQQPLPRRVPGSLLAGRRALRQAPPTQA